MSNAWPEPNRTQSSPAGAAPRPTLILKVCPTGPDVVHVTGELDIAVRDPLVSVSTAGRHPEMVIDLAGCTFMDCSGYGALINARLVVEGQGRSLAITGQSGQPARLFDLIAELESVH